MLLEMVKLSDGETGYSGARGSDIGVSVRKLKLTQRHYSNNLLFR